MGIEYLWKLITDGVDEVAERAIQLMREIYTNISPQLKPEIKRIHQTFLEDTFRRLKQAFDSAKAKSSQSNRSNRINSLLRLLVMLKEYLSDCDTSYHKDRMLLPMSRAFRGRPVTVIVRINTGQNRQTEDLDHLCHSNETWGQIRRLIAHRYSPDLSPPSSNPIISFFRYRNTYGVLELYRNNELIHPLMDNKTLAQTDGRDRIVSELPLLFLRPFRLFQSIAVRWVQHPIHAGSSGESDSSESEMNNNDISSIHHPHGFASTDSNAEHALPSVVSPPPPPSPFLPQSIFLFRYSRKNTSTTNFSSKWPISLARKRTFAFATPAAISSTSFRSILT